MTEDKLSPKHLYSFSLNWLARKHQGQKEFCEAESKRLIEHCYPELNDVFSTSYFSGTIYVDDMSKPGDLFLMAFDFDYRWPQTGIQYAFIEPEGSSSLSMLAISHHQIVQAFYGWMWGVWRWAKATGNLQSKNITLSYVRNYENRPKGN
jgi:hypothetical protein